MSSRTGAELDSNGDLIAFESKSNCSCNHRLKTTVHSQQHIWWRHLANDNEVRRRYRHREALNFESCDLDLRPFGHTIIYKGLPRDHRVYQIWLSSVQSVLDL